MLFIHCVPSALQTRMNGIFIFMNENDKAKNIISFLVTAARDFLIGTFAGLLTAYMLTAMGVFDPPLGTDLYGDTVRGIVIGSLAFAAVILIPPDGSLVLRELGNHILNNDETAVSTSLGFFFISATFGFGAFILMLALGALAQSLSIAAVFAVWEKIGGLPFGFGFVGMIGLPVIQREFENFRKAKQNPNDN